MRAVERSQATRRTLTGHGWGKGRKEEKTRHERRSQRNPEQRTKRAPGGGEDGAVRFVRPEPTRILGGVRAMELPKRSSTSRLRFRGKRAPEREERNACRSGMREE